MVYSILLSFLLLFAQVDSAVISEQSSANSTPQTEEQSVNGDASSVSSPQAVQPVAVVEPAKKDTAALDSAKMLPKKITNEISKIKDEAIHDLIDTFVKGALHYAVHILMAILIFFVGRWIIRYLVRIIRAIFNRRNTDPSFSLFILNFINVACHVVLVLVIVRVVGADTTSFVALLASTGVGIGMAMSGTLQNFAGGVLILFLRPYRVGDTIEAMQQMGIVKEIQIFHTIIATPDNKTILIPNGSLSSGIVNNYTKQKSRRVEWKFSIGYGEDFDAAKAFIISLLEDDDRIHTDPPYVVVIDSFADSSVVILVRAWTNVDCFWEVKWDINERYYKHYARHGLSIPFPQMDVHIVPEKGEVGSTSL